MSNINLAVAKKQGDSNFVHTCLRTQSTMELQKLTKRSQKTLDMGRLHMGEKYLCKNLGVKEGGGSLFEGGRIFGSLRY